MMMMMMMMMYFYLLILYKDEERERNATDLCMVDGGDYNDTDLGHDQQHQYCTELYPAHT